MTKSRPRRVRLPIKSAPLVADEILDEGSFLLTELHESLPEAFEQVFAGELAPMMPLIRARIPEVIESCRRKMNHYPTGPDFLDRRIDAANSQAQPAMPNTEANSSTISTHLCSINNEDALVPSSASITTATLPFENPLYAQSEPQSLPIAEDLMNTYCQPLSDAPQSDQTAQLEGSYQWTTFPWHNVEPFDEGTVLMDDAQVVELHKGKEHIRPVSQDEPGNWMLEFDFGGDPGLLDSFLGSHG
jgi:hypothetical protein